MRTQYRLTPITSTDGLRRFLVDFHESGAPRGARTLVVACPLGPDRSACICNRTAAACPSCREGRTCGCPIEVEIECGRAVDGFRVVRAPDMCPLNGTTYSDAEREELTRRVLWAWENTGAPNAGLPVIGDDEDRAHSALWHRHLATTDDC